MTDIRFSDCHPLLVDDDADFTLLVRRCLERAGVPRLQIRSCADGDEAVDRLGLDLALPSFVLLDLHMPRRSGLDVLEWIRSAPGPLADLSVYMLTSSSDPADVARAFQLGVGSYFIKPMDNAALNGVLTGIVAYWSSRARPSVMRGSLSP